MRPQCFNVDRLANLRRKGQHLGHQSQLALQFLDMESWKVLALLTGKGHRALDADVGVQDGDGQSRGSLPASPFVHRCGI